MSLFEASEVAVQTLDHPLILSESDTDAVVVDSQSVSVCVGSECRHRWGVVVPKSDPLPPESWQRPSMLDRESLSMSAVNVDAFWDQRQTFSLCLSEPTVRDRH